MKLDYKNPDKKMEDIIKEYSERIAEEIQNQNKEKSNKSKKLTNFNKSKDSVNYRYANDSGMTNQTSTKNNSGVTQDNERVAEAA